MVKGEKLSYYFYSMLFVIPDFVVLRQLCAFLPHVGQLGSALSYN